MATKHILLSYDVEEFDMCFEYAGTIPLAEQIAFSTNGLQLLLQLLNKYNIKATFYTTAVYAQAKPNIIKQLANNGHEVASHTYYHSQFTVADLANSKTVLQNITGTPIYGLRMPRMAPVNPTDVLAAGYKYNSSINPTYLPGRYNNLHISRTAFMQNCLLQLPASVSPWFRVPLFWLCLHNLPFWLYWHFLQRTIKTDGYVNLYYHPWEFLDYTNLGGAKFPKYVTKNSGAPMLAKTEALIQAALKKGYQFSTTYNYLTTTNLL
jgi:peptidoglycan/xylan/chitin deacetylase (PgdA/CDA1 family)